ncbi:hypothetical protein GCM10009609_05560 [Pseudonocardia aurantiaca]
MAEQEDGQPIVPGGGEPAEGVEVGEPVGIVDEVAALPLGPSVAAQVEPVHRPPGGDECVDDVAVAARVLAETVAEQEHPGGRLRREPRLPEQLDVADPGQPALDVLQPIGHPRPLRQL